MTRTDEGQVTVFVLGMALVCFAVAGVVVDGTRAFIYRRTLQNAADASALAGAAEIDRTSYYVGNHVALDAGRARAQAAAWLARRNLDVDVVVRAGRDEVRVLIKGSVAATFLSLVGIRDLPVAAEARAAPLGGALD